MDRVAGIVLAAGLGRRMGRPKAEIIIDGSRLVDRAIDRLRGAGCDPIVAVVPVGVEADALIVVNADPERGMLSSLELGLAALDAVDAVAVTLVDMPGMTSAAVGTVIAGWSPARIAVGVVAGRRTHPTVMSPAMWREALASAGADEGARRYLAQREDLIDEVAVTINPADLDTPEDLAAWTTSRDA